MNRLGILFAAFLLSGIISGQTSYDLLLKSKALIATGKPSQAIGILSSSIANKPDSRLYSERAEAKLLNGDISGAINDYNSADNITQFSGEYGLARIYAIKGDAATALYHLELSMKSQFRKSDKEIFIDPSFAKIENSAEWRLFWKKDWYTTIERNISEIEYYVKTGKTDDARTVYTEIERAYPDHQSVKYADAIIKISSGKPGDAIKLLSDLLAAEPGNEAYLRALAAAQIGASNAAGASDTYSRMISLEVPDAELYMLRAECYRKTGEKEKAMADIIKYLSLYPGSKAALSQAGKTESSSGNNLKALEYFSENLRLHPNDPECYVDRGNSYFLSKSWQWAIKDYSMSLDLDPQNSDVWLSKGIALLNSGKTEDACYDFRRSFALGNKNAVEYISRNCIK